MGMSTYAQSSISLRLDYAWQSTTSEYILKKAPLSGSLQFPELDVNQAYALYLSNAEIQRLVIGDQMWHAGSYPSIDSLSSQTNPHFFVVEGRFLSNALAHFSLEQQSDLDYRFKPVLYPKEVFNSYYQNLSIKNRLGTYFTLLFLGAIGVFLLFSSGMYIQTRNRDFLFYSLYLGSILIHNGIQADGFLNSYLLFPHQPILYHSINEFFQMFIYSFFMLFISQFLELQKHTPRIHRFLSWSILSTWVFAVAFLISAYFFRAFSIVQDYLSILWIIVALQGLIVVIGLYFKHPLRIKYYIIIGSIFLVIGSSLELASSLVTPDSYYWNIWSDPTAGWFPFNYTQLAILGEVVCFALGIGSKIRSIDRRVKRNQRKEIKTLQQTTLKKEAAINDLLGDLQAEKLTVHETHQMMRMLESKMSVIKFQLNPHFLYNHLNVIHNFILMDQNQEASEYLLAFSKLLRESINKSEAKFVRISDELAYLKQYIQLERKRLSSDFHFQIQSTNVDIQGREIPPFLFQHYLEFILWNKIDRQSKDAGVEIILNEQEDGLNWIIRDRGQILQYDGAMMDRIIKNIKTRLHTLADTATGQFEFNLVFLEEERCLRLTLHTSQSELISI